MQAEIFDKDKKKKQTDKSTFKDPSFTENKSEPVHRWVPWIAGFSSNFVKNIIKEKLNKKGRVLDPFAGVGTTLIESNINGHESVGFELNPYASLVCKVKLNALTIDVQKLDSQIDSLKEFKYKLENTDYSPNSKPPEGFRTRKEFYSSPVLNKVLAFKDFIETINENRIRELFDVAFASTMIRYSNYSYEPSLGTRSAAGKDDIINYPVFNDLISKLDEIRADIKWLKKRDNLNSHYEVIKDSFFKYKDYIEKSSVDLIITSPPYLNNYHYVRNTRPHLYWLGFVDKPKDTKFLEKNNFGKYWQTVRSKDIVELDLLEPPKNLVNDLDKLRSIKPEKGIYGGNGWANYAATYFNDCYKFAEGIKHSLKKDGSAYIVLGNSILQGVMIPTDLYFGKIAETVGLKLVDINIPKEKRIGNSIINSEVRVNKARKEHKLYESVVELRL